MRIVSLLCLLACVCAGVGRAQQLLTWEDITGPSGYDMVVNGNEDTLYASNGRGVVFVSSDGGFHWSGILGFPSRDPIVDMASNHHNLVVSLTDFSVVRGRYKTLLWNGQPNSWATIFLSDFDNFSNIAVDGQGGVYAFSFGELMRYQNGSWAFINTNLPFRTENNQFVPIHNTVQFGEDGILYVGADSIIDVGKGGLFSSADSGRSWTQMLGNYRVTAIAGSLHSTIIVGTDGGILTSSDGGQTWRGAGLTGYSIDALLLDQQNTLFAIADGAVYRYDASGSTWVQTTRNSEPLQSLTLIPPGTLLASSEGAGAFRSTDGGTLWGGGEMRGKDVFAIATAPSGEVVAGTLGSGVYRSLFGGSSWVSGATSVPCDYISSLTNSGSTMLAGGDCGVLASTDGGTDWQSLSGDAISGSAYAVAVPSPVEGTILAGTNFGVVRSDDGGATWQNSGLQSSVVYFLDASPGGVVIAGTATQGIFISTDAGLSWASRGIVRDDLGGVLASPSGSLIVGVYGGIYRSVDDGSSWTYRQFDRSYVYSLAAGDSMRIYAGTGTTVFASFDDGVTWQAGGDSGIAQKPVLALHRAPAGPMLAGTYRGGVYRSLQTPAAAYPDGVGPVSHLPTAFALYQNYPNPFNPSTEIRYAIPEAADVRLSVVNLLGQVVAHLVQERQMPGEYHVQWKPEARSSGVYFYTLEAGKVRVTKKMLLVR